jgi:WD40 repeat protein
VTFAAYGESTQYNAPHGTINVAHYHAGAPAVIRRPWMAPPLAGGLVPRPDVAAPLAELVCGEGADPVAVTGIHGTGGFGKTTLAVWLCHQPEVRHRFPGGLLWTTLGEHVADADLAARIDDLIAHLTGERPAFTDPVQAGYRLGELLDSRPDPTLLVLDDVWAEHQLEPFRWGGTRCRRLVTTRNRWVLPPDGTALRVDEMTADQAAALLTRGLPPVPADLVEQVLVHTGRWPVLLALANRAAVRGVSRGTEPARALRRVLSRLTAEGPAAFDIDDVSQQHRAVAATVRAGLDLLPRSTVERFVELAVFAEDTDIPTAVLELLWGATGGLSAERTEWVCEALGDLSLLLEYRPDPGYVRLHDVVRAYLVHEAAPARLAALHGRLVDAAARLTDPAGAWWTLPARYDYLVEHLTRHLAAAGRTTDLTLLVTDLRWVEARLRRHGPAGVEADLARAGDQPVTDALARFVRQAGHLFGPIEPPSALGAILASRLDGVDELRPLLDAYAPTLPTPRLANRRPLPDQPHPALRRTLAGHRNSVLAVAVAPDAAWLATGSMDDTARVWDAATGHCRHILAGHTDAVRAVAIAPDGTWLATASDDGTVRIWDPATGECRHVLRGHRDKVYALAIAPDGTWLATGGYDNDVRIWDPVTGRETRTVRIQNDMLAGLAVAPDGWLISASYDTRITVLDPATGRLGRIDAGSPITSMALDASGTWLVTGDLDNTVRVWDMQSGECRLTRRDVTGTARSVAVAPDATWFAAGGDHVHVRDVATGDLRHRTEADDLVTVMAVAPDGTWLATGGGGELRIRDPATGRASDPLTGHTAAVLAMAPAPHGRWLATASADRTVRIWDPRPPATAHRPASATRVSALLAAAPDGTWLVTAGRPEAVRLWDPVGDRAGPPPVPLETGIDRAVFSPDGAWLATVEGHKVVRIWDVATRTCRHTLPSEDEVVETLGAAPDGTWLATAGAPGTVRIWDVATGALRHAMPGHLARVYGMRVAPDGSWLATTDRYALRVWDSAGAPLCTVAGAGQLVGAAPDGRWIATCDARSRVRLHDPRTGEPGPVLSGHTDRVWRLAVAPDGTWCATAGIDGTVRIWDLETGTARHVLTGHTGAVRSLALTPDAARLASAGDDGTLRIWEMADGVAIAAIRAESRLWSCHWLPGESALWAVGSGVYYFDLLDTRLNRAAH